MQGGKQQAAVAGRDGRAPANVQNVVFEPILRKADRFAELVVGKLFFHGAPSEFSKSLALIISYFEGKERVSRKEGGWGVDYKGALPTRIGLIL